MDFQNQIMTQEEFEARLLQIELEMLINVYGELEKLKESISEDGSTE